jgi:hypothetical protein
MIKLNKYAFLIVALIVGAIGFAACNTTSNNTTNGNTANTGNTTGNATTNTTSNATSNTNTNMAKTETASADKIGVAECDDFLEKYEACVTTKVPEAARASFNSSMQQWRSSWKQLASNPQTKGTLADVCKKSLESAKQSLSTYSCAW